MEKKRNIHVGTSGWMYDHWKGRFYPEEAKKNKLEYYCRFFGTVEINNSFYHLPSKETFKLWKKRTPEKFVFSVKAIRYITHVKRLKTDDEGIRAAKNFYLNASGLGNKLAVILFQLPPNFKYDRERVENFLKTWRRINRKKIKAAFEFRHASWFNDELYEILKKYHFGLVVASTPHYPMKIVFTSDFIYFRFHGKDTLYGSKYSDKELEKWADEINNFPTDVQSVFLYFDNDANAYATENAVFIKNLLT